MKAAGLHAVVLHDELAPDARADEVDVLVQAEEFERALAALGYTTSRLPFGLDLAAVRTFLNNGTVYTCRREILPAGAPAAAMFRFAA